MGNGWLPSFFGWMGFGFSPFSRSLSLSLLWFSPVVFILEGLSLALGVGTERLMRD